MIIFITIPWFRPAFRAGGPIQSIDNLVCNPINGVRYKIYCSNTDLNGELLNNIDVNVWSAYNEFTDVFYATKNNSSKELFKQIKIIQPNKIFIVGLFSWQYNLLPLFFVKGVKKIISVRGMLHPGALSQKKTKKYFFLKFLQFFALFNQLYFHATNNEESGFIKNIFGKKAKVFVANNISKKIEYLQPLNKTKESLKLITIALISPMKNHLLVLKALAKTNFKIEYNIYGPIKDSDYWLLCKKEIDLLPHNVIVNYYGEIIYNKISEVLQNNHVFIMPSKSENYGHAIIEALQAGRPVITSYNTPWSNLKQCSAGLNVDTTENEILDAINSFANMNSDEYEDFSKNAHKYAIDKNSNETILNEYLTMYNS